MTTRPDDWCILRMAPPRTLAVVRSLGRVGIEAWTPTESRLGRRPAQVLELCKVLMLS